MSRQHAKAFHTVGEEWLASYSAGSLSPLKRLVIACQKELQPGLAAQIDHLDEVCGAFLETAKGETVSDDFMPGLMTAINQDPATRLENAENKKTVGISDDNQWAPQTLQTFLDHQDIELKWRKSGPGISHAALTEENGERLYLLKAKPGLELPMHSHAGEEWTLILQGGYHVGDTGYLRGDLHREDESCTHQPIIDHHGEECISLVVDHGKLKFNDPILRLLQPLLRV